MALSWFRRNSNRQLVRRLHGEIVAAARQPAFYTSHGVADSFDGRFEMLALFSSLVVRRLTALPEPGPAIAQELTDGLFQGLDDDLREMGVGDLAVPKRIKKLAAALLGRRKAYTDALARDDDAELRAALARNIHAEQIPPDDPRTRALASYVHATVKAFDAATIDVFQSGPLPFPPATAETGEGKTTRAPQEKIIKTM